MRECEGITDKQLQTTNGCGSSAWFAWVFRLPKWIIPHDIWCACNCHDIIYQDATKVSLLDKREADDMLYDAIYYSAYNGSIYLRDIKIVIAEIVYYCLNTWLSELCWNMAKNE